MANQRTRQSMETDNTKTTVTEETLESFDSILAEALREIDNETVHTEEFGDDVNDTMEVEGDPNGEVDDGANDNGASSIEELVEQLRDIVERIAAEVGVDGDADDDDFDDNFDDETIDDDLRDVPTEAKCMRGHPIKNTSLQSKDNKVPGKLNKRGGKAGTTAVHGKHGKVNAAPKSNLNDKGKNKVQGQKGPGEDLF